MAPQPRTRSHLVRATRTRTLLLTAVVASSAATTVAAHVGPAQPTAARPAAPGQGEVRSSFVTDHLEPAPTPDPTPAPTAPPAPTPAPAAPPAAQPAPRAVVVSAPAPPVVHHVAPAPAPQSHRNWLRSADGTLNTGVGIYSDCTGASAVPSGIADIDTCVHDVTYFVGHNAGVFTPLLHLGTGSIITWWDNAGTAHRLQVVATRQWQRASGVPSPVSSNVTVQFQTCLVPDGSLDLILDAVAI